MSKPRRVAELLKSVLRQVETRVGRRELNDALAEALGPDTASHCKVSGFRGGRLVVETDSAPLFAELTGFQREAVRLAMNKKLEKQKIAQLTFRMGGTGHV